jgi:uncharacterized protein DUF4255
MSAGFAVAAATATLANRLHNIVGDAVPGTRITTLNPGSQALRNGDPIVNLYLFRTNRNGSVSNNDLPTRGPAGKPMASPTLMLDLDYMITFFGDDARLDPQRLLGLVAGGLNAAPFMDSQTIRATIAANPLLTGTALDLQANQIRITPMNLAPDALARLWSEFVDVPYQLTQLYTVTPVGLEVTLPVTPVLPVRQLGIVARPAGPIAVRGIVNAAAPGLPLSGGGQMAIRMSDPGQPNLTVQLNGFRATGVVAGRDADGHAALLVKLSSAQPGPLIAGPLVLQVVLIQRDGTGIVAQSNPFRMIVNPGLDGAPIFDAASKQLHVQMALTVPAEASAALMLYRVDGAPGQSRQIACLPRTVAGNTLTAPADELPAGKYLVGVEIDELMSVLDYANGGYTGPTVVIPEAAP